MAEAGATMGRTAGEVGVMSGKKKLASSSLNFWNFSLLILTRPFWAVKRRRRERNRRKRVAPNRFYHLFTHLANRSRWQAHNLHRCRPELQMLKQSTAKN